MHLNIIVATLLAISLAASVHASGKAVPFKDSAKYPAQGLAQGPAKIPSPISSHTLSMASDNSPSVTKWCSEIGATTRMFGWKLDPCRELSWIVGGESVEKRPLVYAEFGNPQSENTTLIFSMVHGDEITPLYVGLQLAHWLKKNPEALKQSRVIVAPLVNPDGYFKRPRTRMNARGVDLNRNFATQDWHTKALQIWKARLRSDRRRFPGHQPRSEPETLFQEELINKFRPQKILSIHSPLNHLDYDGPSALTLSRFKKDYIREWDKLRKRLKVVSAGFFPGSLGNYAGRELDIPTWTKELKSANASKAAIYWKESFPEILTLIEFQLPGKLPDEKLSNSNLNPNPITSTNARND